MQIFKYGHILLSSREQLCFLSSWDDVIPIRNCIQEYPHMEGEILGYFVRQ